MPDVSRVVYDAALARVRAVIYKWDEVDVHGYAEDLTLAALGLDEPPTKAVKPPVCGCKYPGCLCRPPSSVFFPVPPTETPKACPTCGGGGRISVWNCGVCDGSGIDGGTP